MASRQMKMPAKTNNNSHADEDVVEVFSQSKQPERGRYLLQVDRQTKSSYATLEAAETAAKAIKKNYSVVQVSVYDSVEHTYTMIGAPAAAS